MPGLAVSEAPPRALVVHNELPGPRPSPDEMLDALVAEGTLGGHATVPYVVRLDEGLTDAEIDAEILSAARETGAALVLFVHTGTLALDETMLAGLRALPSAPALVYWEGDGYHPWYFPAPPATLRVMRSCDVVFVPSGGLFVRGLRRAGCPVVRYAPSSASGVRFPHVWSAGEKHEWDVVMTANRTVSRVAGRTAPGARRRIALVRALQRRYGRRFGLFGHGWGGPSALGPLPFDEQAVADRHAVVAVGQNNTTWPLGFSNRLPIGLATGTPVLYGRCAGYRNVFGLERDAWFFDSVEEALRGIDALLETEPAELDRRSAAGRAFLESDLERLVVLRHIVRTGLACRAGSLAALPPPARVPRWQLLPPV